MLTTSDREEAARLALRMPCDEGPLKDHPLGEALVLAALHLHRMQDAMEAVRPVWEAAHAAYRAAQAVHWDAIKAAGREEERILASEANKETP